MFRFSSLTTYRSFVLVGGIIIGFLLYAIVDVWPFQNASDTLELVGIIVNVLIGVAIVFLIQKRLSDDRGVKDYFIAELQDIKNDYVRFVNGLYRSEHSTKHIIEWFKTMSVRLGQMEHFCEHNLKFDRPALTKLNREVHKVITQSSEFNNSFRSTAYSPTPSQRTELFDKIRDLKFEITYTVIRVNNA